MVDKMASRYATFPVSMDFVNGTMQLDRPDCMSDEESSNVCRAMFDSVLLKTAENLRRHLGRIHSREEHDIFTACLNEWFTEEELASWCELREESEEKSTDRLYELCELAAEQAYDEIRSREQTKHEAN